MGIHPPSWPLGPCPQCSTTCGLGLSETRKAAALAGGGLGAPCWPTPARPSLPPAALCCLAHGHWSKVRAAGAQGTGKWSL